MTWYISTVSENAENDGKDYELYYVPLMSYVDIIDEADDFLDDFRPSDELTERYGILEK